MIARVVRVLVEHEAEVDRSIVESLKELLSSEELVIAGIEKKPF